MSIIPIAGLIFFLRFDSNVNQASHPSKSVLAESLLPPPLQSASGSLILYEFDAEIRQSRVFDILVDGDRLWLGTGKGLLAWEASGQVIRYQQFADASFEWVRNLALDNGLLALDSLTADGNTGGHYAGSYVFNIASRQWQYVGGNVLDQVWLNGAIWQRPVESRVLQKSELQEIGWQAKQVALNTTLCSEASMAAIDGEIWIAQQGTRGTRFREAKPCGVIRYDPASGNEVYIDEQSGLNSGFARDVAGDADQIWISHSIKHDRLSLLDRRTGRWQSARPVGSANSIMLGRRAIWLASPSESSPLIRIDRTTQTRTNIKGVPTGFYVSAIAEDENVLWLGLYKQNWHGNTFTIDSYVASYVDR